MTERPEARVRVPGFVRRHKQLIETVAASIGINIAWRAIACVICASAASAAIATVASHDNSARLKAQLQLMQGAAAAIDIPPAPPLTAYPPNQRVEIKLLRHPPARFTNAKTRLTLRNTLARCAQIAASSSFSCSLTHSGVMAYKATLDGPRR